MLLLLLLPEETSLDLYFLYIFFYLRTTGHLYICACPIKESFMIDFIAVGLISNSPFQK